MQDNNDILSQFSQNAAQRAADLNQSLDIDAQKRTQAAQGGGFITNDQIAADQAAKDQQQAQQPDANAQTTPQPGQGDGNGGNWFTKALPTIGSIAAPILGALLAPETGGASLLAGLALASAGSGAGKLGENALEGKKDITNGVGGAALEGGVGQLAGGLAGKALGAGAKAIGNVAEKGIAGKAAEQAGVDAVEKQQAFQNTWGGLKNSLLERHNLENTRGLANNLGIDETNPAAWTQNAQHASDIYNGVINDALAKSGGLDTTGLTGMLKDTIGKQASTLGSLDPTAIKKGMIGMANNPASSIYGQVQGDLGGLFNSNAADPVALREAISKIGARMADAKPGISATTGAIDPVQKAQYNALSDIYNNLKGMVYDRPQVADQIKNLSGNILPEDVGGNAALADHLNSVLTNAQHPQDVINDLSRFVDMSKLGQAGESLAQNSARPAVLNGVKQDVPELATSAPTIPTSKTGMVAGLANKVLGAVGNGGATSQVASKLADNLTGASAVANKIASRLPEGATPNIAGNYATNAGLIGTIGAQAVAGAPNYQGPAGTGTAVNALDIPQGSGNPFQDILHSNDIASTPAKMAIIDSMFNGAMGNHTSLSDPAIAEYLNKQQSLRNAASQVNSYIQALNAAGGAQGRVGGLLGELGGALTGGPAAALGNQRAALEQSLTQALGRPVSLPDMQLTQSGANGVLGQLNAALHAQAGA